MKRQTDFFKKRELYYERRSWGRSSSDRQVHWWRGETVGRHTEPLHHRESSVLVAPALGTTITNRLILMNKHPAMNDDSTVMDSSVERNHASLLRAMRRKRDEMRRKRVKMNRKRFKARRFLKTVSVHTSTVHSELVTSPMSDEIMSDTQLILRAIEVIPGAFIRRSGRRWRKTTAFSSESSSPENSDPVLTSDQISPHLSGIEHEKMDQGCEESVCKCKILSNKLKSLKYLINQITNANYCKEKFYLEEKYNHIFNRFFKNLKVDVDKSNQFAFVIFIKKDGSYDEVDWDNIPDSTEKCPEVYKPEPKVQKHSEDYIFVLLKEILSKSDCPYKEALIFSLNSPCLARPNNTSCKDQAIDIAEKLHEKHGMKMIIGFYKPWGINGPYEKILPYKPLKVCTYTFNSQTFKSNDRSVSSKKTEKKREVDVELVDPIYNKVIPDAQNEPFSMDDIINRPKCNLQPFFKKIFNPKNKEKLKDIVLNLFRHQNLHKTFDDFKKHGLEMFEKCMKGTLALLIDDDYDDSYLSDPLSDDDYNAEKNLQISAECFFPLVG